MMPTKYPVIQFCTSNSTHIKMWKPVISFLRQKNTQVKIEILSLDSYYAQTPLVLVKDVGADAFHILKRSWSRASYWSASGLKRLILVAEALLRVNLKLRSTRPDLIVLGNDIGIVETIIINAASLLKIPTVLVQDGILNGNLRRENAISVSRMAKVKRKIFKVLGFRRNHIYGHSNSTAMAVMGQYSYDLLQDEGKDMSGVFITGQPRFDNYVKVVRDRAVKSIAANARRRYRIPDEMFTISFFTQPMISYGLMEPKKWDYIVEAIFLSVKEAIGDDDCRLVIKLHPAEPLADFVSRYSQHIESLGNHAILDENADLLDVIQVSDLVIVYSSTVSLEAILFDKPVIMFDPYEFTDDYKFVKMGAVTHVAAKDELVRSIVLFKKNSGATLEMRTARSRAVDYHLSNFDGLASSRVADLILKYLH